MNVSENSNGCARHPGQPAASNCGVCAKPICRQCIQESGYYCSTNCLEKSRGEVSDDEIAQRQHDELAFKKAARAGKIVLWLALTLILAVVLLVTWKLFLDPSGKVAWQWNGSTEAVNLEILGATENRLLVWDNHKIVLLDAEDGREITSIEMAIENGFPWAARLDDGFLVAAANTLHQIHSTGDIRFKKVFAGRIHDFCVDHAAATAFLALGAAEVRRLDEPQMESRVTAVELEKGTEKWSKHLTPGKMISRMTAAAGKLAIVYLQQQENFQTDVYLGLFDAADGDAARPLKLPATPTWGPQFGSRLVLARIDDSILAFDEAGEEVWSVSGLRTFSQIRIIGDQLLISSDNILTCVDLETAEQVWEVPFAVNLQGMIVGDEYLYATGVISETRSAAGDASLPAAYQELDGAMNDMGINATALNTKQTHILTCLRRKDGEQLWAVRNVLGNLYGDKERLVVLMDTSETSIFEMLGGGKGSTIVRQYNLQTGEKMYERSSDLGVAAPRLVGRYLCCIAYERVEKEGLLNSFMATPSAAPEESKTLGIVAFRIK